MGSRRSHEAFVRSADALHLQVFNDAVLLVGKRAAGGVVDDPSLPLALPNHGDRDHGVATPVARHAGAEPLQTLGGGWLLLLTPVDGQLIRPLDELELLVRGLLWTLPAPSPG